MSAYDATVASQRERNNLTCFNEKVQIKNVNLATPYFIFPKINLLWLARSLYTN